MVFVDSNAELKLKFQRLHTTVVESVNVTRIIDQLLAEGVLGAQDIRTLQQKSDTQQQCRDLLALLHTSGNPQAFVHLYRAIKNEAHLQWLVKQIDDYTDQSLIDSLKRRYINDKTGKC